MIQKQKIIMEMIREKMIHMKKMTVKKIKQIIMIKMTFGNIMPFNSIMKIIQVNIVFINSNKVIIVQSKNRMTQMKMINMIRIIVNQMGPNRILPETIQKVTQKYIMNKFLFSHWIYKLPSVCMDAISKVISSSSLIQGFNGRGEEGGVGGGSRGIRRGFRRGRGIG